ncbi:MAG: hypothetical protein M1356_01695 [Gammaproteobacteria bacterium]|nr:hypothetical protein [Gammaproteobacteria bacterium]
MAANIKLSLLATVVALSLAACGGSSGSDSPGSGGPGNGGGNGGDDGSCDHCPIGLVEPAKDPGQPTEQLFTHTLNGRVHYYDSVAGAEVCVDTTRDLQCDEDSPIAITSTTGLYDLTIESPYEFAEHFVIARFPADTSNPRPADAALMNDNGDIVLSARGYYQGHVNTLTTLESWLYDPSFSSFEQNELYSIGRLMISRNFSHPAGDAYHQLFSGQHVLSPEALESGNNRVFSRYQAAMAYTDEPLAALQAIFVGATEDDMASRLAHLGYIGERQPLSDSQRHFAEDNFLQPGNAVYIGSSDSSFDVYNERADEVAWVNRNLTQLQFNKGTLSSFLPAIDQRCWHLQEQRWMITNVNDTSYSLVEPVSTEADSYRLISASNGVEFFVHFEVIDTDSDVFKTAFAPWMGPLELDDYPFADELVYVRSNGNEGVCFSPSSNGASDASKPFSEMDGGEIVRAINPQLHQTGEFSVDSDYQRITVNQSGFSYDYRVMQLGGAEVLMLHAVHASNTNSYPGFYTIYNGRVQRLTNGGFLRQNIGFRNMTRVLLDDATAVDLIDHLETVTNR